MIDEIENKREFNYGGWIFTEWLEDTYNTITSYGKHENKSNILKKIWNSEDKHILQYKNEMYEKILDICVKFSKNEEIELDTCELLKNYNCEIILISPIIESYISGYYSGVSYNFYGGKYWVHDEEGFKFIN